MDRERVLITGGAGFIGRALVGRCLAEGHQVGLIDNLCAGRLENLGSFLEQVSFRNVDILDVAALRDVMSIMRPTVVFHLAAHHFIPFCNDHPQETLRVNVEGTHNVLTEAARCGARVAVVASSGAFYPSLTTALSEDVEPAPVDVYGLSKHLAEQVTAYVASGTGMACVAARLFNTYGPCETNPHLIPHIVDCLKRSPRVELGNIETKRDYIYVDDVAQILYRLSRSAREGFLVVNVGTGQEYSAKEIVGTISGLLGARIEISADPARMRVSDKMHQRADTGRLKTVDGIDDPYPLEKGLRHLLVHEGLLRV